MSPQKARLQHATESGAVSPDAEIEYTEPARPRHRGWLFVTLLLIGAAAGGYYFYAHRENAAGDDAKAAKAPARAIPVVVATARRGDIPIYLTGLGTATASNTVTVHTRVDGQVDKIGFTEGQVVKEGDPLVEIDPRPFQVLLQQAEGQMARDQAQLKNSRADLARYEAAREAVAQQQIDTAAAAVAQNEGVIKSDQAQVDSAKLQLTYTKISAPIGGRIGLRLVDKGNIVHAADATGLAVITQTQPIAVVFGLPQDNVPQVVKKMNAGVSLPVFAYDRDLKQKLATGKLIAVDSQIDSATGTLKFKAEFSNEDSALFPNQFVNARLLVDTKRDTVIVPAAAVQRSPQGMFAYVVKPDGTVEMRTITVGPSEKDDVSIESGLTEGETVVTDGVDKLQPGAKVSVGKPGGADGNRDAKPAPAKSSP
jgi:multidrug efflux system membrane fusion protein